MRKSKLLAKIRAGKVARISSIGAPLGYFPAMSAHFGYDAVWVDAEHRAWDANEAREMILRHHLADIDCVWRPPTTEKAALSRLLEDGATALMMPQVNTPERAHQLVAATKFPPLGDRGIDGSGLDARFLVGKPADYPAQSNRETALIVQIETPEAVEKAGDIAAIDGVDILFMGPGDLSLRLGCTASLKDPALRGALEKMAEACRRNRKPWGFPTGSSEDAKIIIDMGAQFVVLGSEFWAVHGHLQKSSAELDELLGEKIG